MFLGQLLNKRVLLTVGEGFYEALAVDLVVVVNVVLKNRVQRGGTANLPDLVTYPKGVGEDLLLVLVLFVFDVAVPLSFGSYRFFLFVSIWKAVPVMS